MSNPTKGLGELPPETHAIFYQKSKSLQAEYGLVAVTISRESLVEKLNSIIRSVNNKFRELDDLCIYETILLFNQVRDATINLIEATYSWQQGFIIIIIKSSSSSSILSSALSQYYHHL